MLEDYLRSGAKAKPTALADLLTRRQRQLTQAPALRPLSVGVSGNTLMEPHRLDVYSRFAMPYQLKLNTYEDVSPAQEAAAQKRYRTALESVLGDAQLVLPVYRAFQKLVLTYGEEPDPGYVDRARVAAVSKLAGGRKSGHHCRVWREPLHGRGAVRNRKQ